MIRRLLGRLLSHPGEPGPQPELVRLEDLEVEVWRKAVRGYRISILPPDGRVRISVPWQMSALQLRQVLDGRMAWIRKHQKAVRSRAEAEREELCPGGWVFVAGKRCRLSVVEAPTGARVLGLEDGVMKVRLPSGSDAARFRTVLDSWYRSELKRLVPPLIQRWEPLIGVHAEDWGVKRMKTRWGSCSIRARRIWLNLELGKKHPDCLEYVVVHELVHLLEASHNARFKALMTRFLPDWQEWRRLLLAGGLPHAPREV